MSQVGQKKPCCLSPANLLPPQQLTESMAVRMCRVCGCKHWEAKADPLNMGIKVL
jgi:hypothetical protein